jgi:transcriptional regulator with XRE-family HTH domain
MSIAHAGDRLKALRKLRALSMDEVAARSRGALDRARIVKAEQGKYKVSTAAAREGFAYAFDLTPDEVGRVISGQLSPEDAAKIAEARAAEVPSPVNSAPLAPEQQGDRLAVLVRLEKLKDARFPYLEACLVYHESHGKRWPQAVVDAARGGHFGERDLDGPTWERALDRLDAVMSHATLDTLKRHPPTSRG